MSKMASSNNTCGSHSSCSSSSSAFDLPLQKHCTKPSCFFCLIKEPEPPIRRAKIREYLKTLPFVDDEELILVVSGLWNIAMTQPDDREHPSLGIFDCMAFLINKAVKDRAWLLRHQNIYIPYYAAHIIGSYTINKVEHAETAVESDVVPPLLELLRGNRMSWVEQRVAVRALGHLASYGTTFEALAVYEEEVVRLAMTLASTCVDVVYNQFVGVKDRKKRLKYHCDLLTRGVGGVEKENRKAEEWTSQLQCWSIHLLNCFAIKERSLDLICRQEFLKNLSEMWGGLVNHTSPCGIGLIRILCYNKFGRKRVSDCVVVVENLCKLSRSCDDWQYMGIDCLVLLLKDPNTRYTVMETATSYLADLIELRSLGNRTNIGESITRALLYEFINHRTSKIKDSIDVQRAIEEIWVLNIDRRKREQAISSEMLEEKRVLANLIKQQGNHKFLTGETEEALLNYTEGLRLCPLKYRSERIMLFSNRAQCHLTLRNPDAAISDATRALCLCNPPNSHANSLWTRSQAYDMKGMAKESLMDSIMFICSCIKSKTRNREKISYDAICMISKQMDRTWLFRDAQMKALINHDNYTDEKPKEAYCKEGKSRSRRQNKSHIRGLSTIVEEPFDGKIGIGIGKAGKSSRRIKTSCLGD